MDGDSFGVGTVEELSNRREVEDLLAVDLPEEIFAETGRLPVVEESRRLQEAEAAIFVDY